MKKLALSLLGLFCLTVASSAQDDDATNLALFPAALSVGCPETISISLALVCTRNSDRFQE
jgi:hypothetical protein